MTITQKIRYYLIKAIFVRFTTKLLALYKKATNYVSFKDGQSDDKSGKSHNLALTTWNRALKISVVKKLPKILNCS
ncbi:hypothetical protein KQI23_20610, partial [Shigella sonnei]|nr:hypothetical protein [Shigella sonnei]